MQGFRRAFVITGFVVLGLGSNLAWHYPRPEALSLQAKSPQSLMLQIEALEQKGIRCRPTENWTDLLVESSQREQARQAIRAANLSQTAFEPFHWQTPSALLADLARLPGVKEANLVIDDNREAVVMLSMQHGAFAGDRGLLRQAVERVQATYPAIQADNIKLLDAQGADLNYTVPSLELGSSLPLQALLQAQLDSRLGLHRSLFLCRLQRTPDLKIHLQSMLYLQPMDERESQVAQELVDQALQKWVQEKNALLRTDQAWRVQDAVYPFLERNRSRHVQPDWRLDRLNGLTLDKGELKEWPLVQRSLPREEKKALQWGLNSPPPTPGQLVLGLSALGPALFGWCLIVPWLLRRHQLSSSASATL